MSCCGQTSDGTLVPRNLSSYLLSRLFIAFCMLESWLSTHDGKDNKKENHFIVLLFYLLIFMLFHCLDTYCIITYCTFSHYFVKISILDIWFLFFLVFLLLTRKYIKKIGYVFKYYTKQFKKKNTVSSTLQKKFVPLLLHSTL